MADKVEYTTEQLEAITKVEVLIRDAKAKADVVASTEAKLIQLDETRKKEIRENMPQEWRLAYNRIELKAKKAMDAIKIERATLTEQYNEIRDDIKPLVVGIIKASVKTEDAGTASFVKGRETADIKGLKGLALEHPAILKLIKTGDPSIQLKLKKS